MYLPPTGYTLSFPSTGDSSEIAPVYCPIYSFPSESAPNHSIRSPQSIHVFPNNSTPQRSFSSPFSTLHSTRRGCKSKVSLYALFALRPAILISTCRFLRLYTLGFLYFPTLTTLHTQCGSSYVSTFLAQIIYTPVSALPLHTTNPTLLLLSYQLSPLYNASST